MENRYALPANSLIRGRLYNYRIIKVLGQGSFGITYLAQLISANMSTQSKCINVAIKEFFIRGLNNRNDTQVTIDKYSDLYRGYREDFSRESVYLSRLRHPHIVQVIETFVSNNTVYYSMEYIDGENLDSYIQGHGGMSEKESLKGAYQIAAALSCIHRYKMLHLDVKPLNIMRRKNGDLVLIDFGLSKQFNSHGEAESYTSICRGTIGYAPMEQFHYKKGDGFLPTLDMYALGATLFKMLTGTNPLEASIIFNEGFPYATMREKNIHQAIIALTANAMAPLKRQRIQTANVFMNEISKIYALASTKQPKSITLAPSPQQQQKANTNGVELCYGFHVKWAPFLPHSYKVKIRELLHKMCKIGEKDQIIYTEYGAEVVNRYPLMSLGDNTWQHLRWILADSNQHDEIFPTVTKIIQQLEIWTGLPFRIADRTELVFTHTSLGKRAMVCDSPKDGILYKGYEANKYIPIPLNVYYDEINFQLVCDGLKPVYSNHFFDVPCTQRPFDELVPIGFGLYKIRRGHLWNITSPKAPMSSFLPECYDMISGIGVWHIPGPCSGISYVGIYATKGDKTTYYEYTNKSLKKIMSLTQEQIRERSIWT